MSKKDMRRADLVVPYVEPQKDQKSGDMSSTFTSTMPMAAMFTRNKLLGWTSVVVALLAWLSESPDQSAKNATPGYLSVGMSLVAVIVTYLPLFLPPTPNMRGGTGTGTEAPPAVPP
ncbi:hypothetical protein GJ744_001907 [Endocarpon pusillum]|uniref:Uncharacterized protein n=1 Tax=Endocarpon pusillum TaxID=364733 RepID=A0A8H7AQ90_9EURO|nr:hypothetical protein GJ744_001907 [Endocarpon pusillum]